MVSIELGDVPRTCISELMLAFGDLSVRQDMLLYMQSEVLRLHDHKSYFDH